jgi:hypothetical protein
MVELFVGIPGVSASEEPGPTLPAGPVIVGTGNPYLPGEPVTLFSWTGLPMNNTAWLMGSSEVIGTYGEVSKVRRVFFSVPISATETSGEITFTIRATYLYDGEYYNNSGAVEYSIRSGNVFQRVMHNAIYATPA